MGDLNQMILKLIVEPYNGNNVKLKNDVLERRSKILTTSVQKVESEDEVFKKPLWQDSRAEVSFVISKHVQRGR